MKSSWAWVTKTRMTATLWRQMTKIRMVSTFLVSFLSIDLQVSASIEEHATLMEAVYFWEVITRLVRVLHNDFIAFVSFAEKKAKTVFLTAFLAEDYYKNDYPDEDSDGGDGEGGHRSARTRDLDYNYLRGAGAGPGFPADSDGSENERYSYSNMSGYEDDDDVYGYENDYGGDLDDDEDGYGGGEASYGRPPTTRQRTRVVRRHGEATTNYDGFSDNEVVEGLEYLDIGGGGGDDEETMEQYRDRIFGQLQREIDRRGEREEDKAHE